MSNPGTGERPDLKPEITQNRGFLRKIQYHIIQYQSEPDVPSMIKPSSLS